MQPKLSAAQTLSVGRAIAVKYLPYYATAIYNLIPHETHKEPTLAVTERAVLFYNPDFVLKQGPKYTAAILVHEVSHLLREHMKRFRRKVMFGRLSRIAGKPVGTWTPEGREYARLAWLWNLSTDAEINDGQPPELPLPPGCILPSTYGFPNGKLAEYYFDLLRKQEQSPQPPQNGDEDDDSEDDDQDDQDDSGDDGDQDDQDGSGGSDDSDNDQDGSGDSDNDQDGSGGSDGDQDSQDGSGSSDGSDGDQEDQGPGHGHCGSCSGHRKPSEPLDGKLDGKEGRSDAELERIRDQVAEAAIEHEKHYGTGVSPGLLWWAKQRLKPPVVRWEQQLASLTRQAVAYQEGMVDYRDDIPNPEQSVLGYGPDIPLLPALVAPVPEVMFLVDRSYSMSERELTEVAQEVPGILRTLSTPLHFGSFDTEMQAIKKVSTVKEALKLFKGGGGTDFRPIFAALKKMKSNRPSVLIIGTDGCGPAPAEPPKGVSVIWLLVGRSAEKPSIGNSETPIRWGKFIYTNPELRAVHVSAAA